MATDDLVPIRMVGRYQVVEEIGRGAMGIVYRGFDPVIGRAVALKTIVVGIVAEDAAEFRQRLYREAAAAGALAHPNIVTIHDVVHDADTTAVAMEFVEGETLASMIARRAPLPLDETLSLIEQICSGLDYAAARGIVHRDIKPANILVGMDGRPRIADFGIARLPASTLTISGAVLGSAGYMSPEQVRGAPLDARSDLFSAATVCYEMLTGRNPFSGTEATNTLYRIVHEPPPPMRPLNPALPASIETVISRALAKDPAARFATGADFTQALRRAATGATSKTSRSTASPEGHSRLLLALGIVGLLGALALGAFMWLGSTPAAPVAPAAATATAATTATATPQAPVIPAAPGATTATGGRATQPAPTAAALLKETTATKPPAAPARGQADVPTARIEKEPAVVPALTASPPARLPIATPPVPVAAPIPEIKLVVPPAFGGMVAMVKGEAYAGVRIFVDDVLLPAPYPAQLSRLAEGAHVIRFTWMSGSLAGKEITQAFDVKAGGLLRITAVPENDQVAIQKIR